MAITTKSIKKRNTPDTQRRAIRTTKIVDPKSAAKPAKSSGMVKAKDTFASRTRTIIKGSLLPADDEIVLAKPSFFAPYQPK